jgi:hypothetical protein
MRRDSPRDSGFWDVARKIWGEPEEWGAQDAEDRDLFADAKEFAKGPSGEVMRQSFPERQNESGMRDREWHFFREEMHSAPSGAT